MGFGENPGLRKLFSSVKRKTVATCPVDVQKFYQNVLQWPEDGLIFLSCSEATAFLTSTGVLNTQNSLNKG